MKVKLREGIKESRKILESYRWFGSQAQEALNAFNEVERFVDNPKPKEKKE